MLFRSGAGKRGPITEKIQKRFFDVVNGRVARHKNWLTACYGGKHPQPKAAAAPKTAKPAGRGKKA